MCIKTYNFCMETQPMACPPLGEMVHTTVINNQCTSSVTVKTHTVPMPTTVLVTVCPSSTTSLKLQTKRTTSACNQCTNTVTIQTRTTVCLTTSAPTAQTVPSIELYATASATGALVVLLLVVIPGWVCTCRIMKKRGKMEINIMQDRYCLVRGLK